MKINYKALLSFLGTTATNLLKAATLGMLAFLGFMAIGLGQQVATVAFVAAMVASVATMLFQGPGRIVYNIRMGRQSGDLKSMLDTLRVPEEGEIHSKFKEDPERAQRAMTSARRMMKEIFGDSITDEELDIMEKGLKAGKSREEITDEIVSMSKEKGDAE